MNSNIGTSSDHIDLEEEIRKLEASIEAAADTVMDLDWDKQISLALDQKTARKYRDNSRPAEKHVCTMCGRYCAIKQVRKDFHG